MGAPEVRVNGDNPGEWEWDGPDATIKTGDKYSITLRSDDPPDARAKWTKEEDAPEPDDGEDDFYCVTGPFNEWDTDRLEQGNVIGHRHITLAIDASGVLEFRFL